MCHARVVARVSRRLASARGPAVLAAGTALAAALLSCKDAGAPRPSPEEAVLVRQQSGLRGLIAAARGGPLIPFEHVLVVLDEKLVRRLLASATPYERVVADKYRVRVDSASVRFADGFALVRLDGRASLANRSEQDVFADVSVFGGLDVVDLDPTSGILRGRVTVIAFEARRVGILGREAPARRLVEALSRERIEEFNVLASDLEVPVRLEREVTIPEVGPEGDIHIPAATVPLRVWVEDVKAFRGKLWVSVGVEVESGGREGGVVVGSKSARAPLASERPR